jgi:hypothetical protein
MSDYARDPAREDDFPTNCWCGEAVQPYPSAGLDHRCRQCAKHCEMDKYRAAEATKTQ